MAQEIVGVVGVNRPTLFVGIRAGSGVVEGALKTAHSLPACSPVPTRPGTRGATVGRANFLH